MKNLSTILLITIFLVAGSTFDVTAQSRNERTASARAAYGYPADNKKSKAGKKKKVHKAKPVSGKNKEVKRRRRDSWAG